MYKELEKFMKLLSKLCHPCNRKDFGEDTYTYG